MLLALASAPLAAQDQGLASPPRYLSMLSTGVPLRLTRNSDFGQAATAPVFIDALGGYVFSGRRVWRHGVAAGLSMNLTEDGGFFEPVAVADQLMLAPTYLLQLELDTDLLILGHLGVPIAVAGESTVGVDLGFATGYRMLAGVGVYSEIGLTGFVGALSTLHLSVSLELGVFLDYEVLP